MNISSVRFERRWQRPVRLLTGLVCAALALAGGRVLAVEGISANALNQIRAMQVEKESRTPAQRKMDSQLIYALRVSQNQPIAPGVTNLTIGAHPESDGRYLVEFDATVTAALLSAITQAGGEVVYGSAGFSQVRARVPLAQIEALAARSDVRFVQPAIQRATRVGLLTTEGDKTHAAEVARNLFRVDGTGAKVGVLSDSVDFLANSVASGDLPPDVTILPGQAGAGSGEGTAMLEIIHDLAPGAKLFFATAFNGSAGFAQNILDLRAAGCDIIVDDVFYFNESPFQDGIIAQAVNTVTADGALYFSATGNEGNQKDGTSGTWEGDFVDGGPVGAPITGKGGNVHSFGATTYDTVTGFGFATSLFWSDPLGGSTNDYDLYILDATGANIVSSSTTIQNGSQDPFEIVPPPGPNQRVVVVKATGAARFLHIDTIRGELAISTEGNAKGHCVATEAYGVAAVDANTSFPNPFSGGPANPVETFSSDGPRRMFYFPDGSPITPGDFSSTGGFVRQKPDIAASDGVQTTVPGFNPFYGTSAAAPHAAAIAALLKSYNPLLTPLDMRNILTNSALDIEATGVDINSGVGLVMALGALQITPPPVPVPVLVVSTNYIIGGNNNGVIDYNECNNLFLVVSNLGFASATHLQVTVSSTNAGVAFGVRNSPYPDLPVGTGGTNIAAFTLSTAPTFVCGTPITVTMLIKCDQVTRTNTVVLGTGSVGIPARFDSSGPVFVQDANPVGTNSLITVDKINSALNKLTVSLYMTHTYDSDLRMELTGPDGTTVPLTTFHGGSGDNFGAGCAPDFFRTTFDDDALQPIASGTPPFVGTFKPDAPLAAFIGKSGTNVNGVWKLHVVDEVGLDVGTLECWSLILSAADCFDGGGTCPGADLAIGMTDAPDPVFIGGNLIYNLAVTNFGPSTANGVVVNQLLPPSVNFVSAVSSQGSCVNAGGSVICTLGAIPLNGVATIAVTVQPTTAGTIGSAASVTSNDPDPDTSNNSASVTTHVNPPAADLAVGILDAPDPALVGGTLTYTVSVTNKGPSAASFVSVTNTLSPSLVVSSATPSQGFASINGNVVTFSFGSLASGTRATGTIVVTPTAQDTVAATAVARALQSDPIIANNTATATTVVGPSANLSITLTDTPDPVVVRSNWTYKITVLNQGPSTATSVVVNHSLPSNVSVVTNTTTQGTVSLAGNNITGNLGTLTNGGSAIINVVVFATNSGLFSSTATVTGAQTDSNTSDNTSSVTTIVAPPNVSIVAAGATLLSETAGAVNGALDPGETVTVQLRLRNAGNVSNTNLVATLLATGGVTSPSGPQTYGLLPPGGLPVGSNYTFTVTGTNGGTVVATLQLQDGPNNLGTVGFTFTLPAVRTFANTNAISITDNQPLPWPAGPASPYPSTINVAGVTGLVGKVTVTFSNLNHTFPADVDALLVGPGGQKVMLMSDAGGSGLVTNLNVTFDDAGGPLPESGQIISTSYAPADFEPGESLDAPAPAGPYGTILSTFAGANPNGTWSLYIVDDATGDPGRVAKGWSLAFTIISPVNQIAEIGVTAASSPNPALVAGTLTNTYTVTNSGPNTATGVAFTNFVPANAVLLLATSTQGSPVTNGNSVAVNLGTINFGSVATITVVVRPTAAGVLTCPANVTTSDTDLNLANNTASAVTTVILPVADMAVSKVSATNSVVVGSNITFTISVTNNGPQTALGAKVTDALPAGLSFVSTTAGNYTNSAGTITVNLGDLAPGAAAPFTLTAVATNGGAFTNVAVVATDSSDTNGLNNSASAVFTATAPAPLIIAAGALLKGESPPANGSVDPGEHVTVLLSLKNVGTADTTSLVATLLSGGGVTGPSGPTNYGALVHGGAARDASFSFTAAGANGGVVIATLQLNDGTNNLGTVAFTFSLPSTATFSNTAAIMIPDHGPASPYPSTIDVGGLTGVVSRVTVNLNGFTHGFPDDVDVLLIGPAGQKVVLMSDTGGGHSVSNLVLTIDDGGAPLPDSTRIDSGTFRPTDDEPGGDSFLPPALVGTPADALAAFNGSNPNGTWSLFVVDDSTGDAGSIGGGWSLTLTVLNTVNPVTDLSITMTDSPDPVFVGSGVTFTIGVTNNGPVPATGVVVTDALPPGLSFVSATSSQGSSGNLIGTVTWNVGSLPVGGGAGISLRAAAVFAANVINTASVAATESDLNPANNTAQTTTTLAAPTAARLTSAAVTNGQLEFVLTGEPGMVYVVFGSTNLTAWVPLATNPAAPNGTFKFTDTSAPGFNQRFYRTQRLIP